MKEPTGQLPGAALPASLPSGKWVAGEGCLGEDEPVGRSSLLRSHFISVCQSLLSLWLIRKFSNETVRENSYAKKQDTL